MFDLQIKDVLFSMDILLNTLYFILFFLIQIKNRKMTSNAIWFIIAGLHVVSQKKSRMYTVLGPAWEKHLRLLTQPESIHLIL